MSLVLGVSQSELCILRFVFDFSGSCINLEFLIQQGLDASAAEDEAKQRVKVMRHHSQTILAGLHFHCLWSPFCRLCLDEDPNS